MGGHQGFREKDLTKYGLSQPARTLERIAQAMHSRMEKAKSDPRVPKALRAQMAQAWVSGVWMRGGFWMR